MKTSKSEGRYGIRWTARTHLVNLDITDDLALLSHTLTNTSEVGQFNSNLCSNMLQRTQGKKHDRQMQHMTPTESHFVEKFWKRCKLSLFLIA
ncbi:unnamed protein product [Schistosoma margrebowiei]|uniref:Uncharacterized protein n=1 Tax=Schistosoma margrebowiei TaxID=48269 RepID=A0A183N0S8_9TREM|nr:unnamed protein product [Schistosoma margrebowiei]